MAHPPVTPHDPPRKLADDLWVVHGSVRVNPVIRFTRNMAIVKNGDELTLINPVRMDEAGLAALDAIGTVNRQGVLSTASPRREIDGVHIGDVVRVVVGKHHARKPDHRQSPESQSCA